MASLNKAVLIGNVGKDPEVRYTQDKKAVTSFSIATTDKWKDKGSGAQKEKTEWHKIVAFGRLGEICGEYLSKGKQVYIEGRLRTRSWEKDGITRYVTEIEATSMLMLGAATGGQKPGNQNTQNQQGNYGVPPDDSDIPF